MTFAYIYIAMLDQVPQAIFIAGQRRATQYNELLDKCSGKFIGAVMGHDWPAACDLAVQQLQLNRYTFPQGTAVCNGDVKLFGSLPII